MGRMRTVVDHSHGVSDQKSLLLLLLGEQLRHRRHGGLPHDCVLPWNSLACSIREA